MPWLLVIALLVGCTANFQQNRLGQSPSPHLQQHAKDPVWWQPWQQETLNYAQKNNKLILLSVGYSTCHWCQVLGKNVFSQLTFAQVVNQNFVAIMVDRDEHPVVDNYFMRALQGISGGGGWPMTLVLTPDLLPVFGTTSIPLDKLIYVLDELQKAWLAQREELLERGKRVADWINKEAQANLSFTKDKNLLHKFFTYYQQAFDPHYGGKKGLVKFPQADDLRVLLRHYLQTKKASALTMVNKTLQTIINSGIYDQIGGGIHRYATDPRWQFPNFEKMLPDQASWLNVLIEAQQTQPTPEYMRAIVSTMEFLLNELQGPEGGFYSAIGADSDGINGGFYTWRTDELRQSLSSDEYQEFNQTHNVTAPHNQLGNRRVIIHKVADERPQTPTVLAKLKMVRDKRNRPFIDKKVITAWNGLAISSLAKLGRLWPSPAVDDILIKNVRHLLKRNQYAGNRLARLRIGDQALGQATLDDYAYVIDALIETYQTTFAEELLLKARQLQQRQDELFYDQKKGSYWLAQDRKTPVDHFKIFHDTAQPSSQAVTAWNLLRLHQFFNDPTLEKKFARLLNAFPDALESTPQAFSQLLLVIDSVTSHPKLLVIAGSKAQCKSATTEISQAFFPYVFFACNHGKESLVPLVRSHQTTNDRPVYTVCEAGACQPPTSEFNLAKKQLLQ